MILAIDCGNTHTVFGTITEEGEIQKIFRMESSRRKTSYEYAADIAQICQLLEIEFAGLGGFHPFLRCTGTHHLLSEGYGASL